MTLLLPLLLTATSQAFAQTPASRVMIVEIQTTGVLGTTSEEFVELYNSSDQTIDISSWKMQYLSAGGTTWQTKATLNGWFYPHRRILIASNGYLIDQADMTYNAGFKLESGHVRIVSPDPISDTQLIVEDLVGWGSALYPEGQPADYAPAGNSLQRKTSEDGQYIDSNNNKNDFQVASTPTPESLNTAPELPEENPPEPEQTPDPTPTETQIPDPVVGSPNPSTLPDQTDKEVIPSDNTDPSVEPIEITELLPNPAAPASDSTDEYIELYNPNSESVDLNGYKLQTGNAYSYNYIFSDQTIEPHGYAALYVRDTGLILANSSGKARLISANGSVTFETDAYENAKEGEAWVYVGSTWQWTDSPTPGSPNVVTSPVDSNVPTSSAPKTSVKKSMAKPTKVTKPKTATQKKSSVKSKTTKPKTSKSKTAVAGAKSDTPGGNDLTGSSRPLHKIVIAIVGLLALGYAVYEYKDDIANKIYEFRRNRKLGKSAGPAT